MTQKKSQNSIILILLSVWFPQIATGAEIMNGNLKVREGSQIFVVDEGRAQPLRNGFIQLEFRKTSFWTFLTGSYQMEISQGSKRGVLFMGASDFKGFSSFRTPPSGGQSFLLEGHGESRLGSKRTMIKIQNCSRSGFCFACTPGLDISGKMTSTCGIKYSSQCSGRQRVEVEIQEEEREPIVTIRDVNTKKIVGEIIGERAIAQMESVIQPLEDCQ